MKIFGFFVVVFLIAITFIRLLLGYLPENQITFTELLSLVSSIDVDFDRTLQGIADLGDIFKPLNLPGNLYDVGFTDIEAFRWFFEFCSRIGMFIAYMAETTFGFVVDIVSFLGSILNFFYGLVRPAVS